MVFTLSVAISLILLLLSFMGKKAGWNLLGLFGACIAFLLTLVLSSDGNLTYLGTTIAAANGNFISDFNLIAWTPTFVAGGEATVTMRRLFHI